MTEDNENNSSQKKISADKLRRDPGLQMQEYLSASDTPEETLFKINELLFAAQHENTRKHPRAPISAPVRYEIGGVNHQSTTYTLSQRGAFIKHPDPPAEGTKLDLWLDLEDGEDPIHTRGEVLHSSPFDKAMAQASLSGMSVLFVRIGKDERRRIDKLVRQYRKKMGKKPA